MREGLGVRADLRPAFSFVYVAEDLHTGLTAREHDHVLVGRLRTEPVPSPEEIAALDWREPPELLSEIRKRPDVYTPWFRETLPELDARGLLRQQAEGSCVRAEAQIASEAWRGRRDSNPEEDEES
jgi:isopentenyldiphosphate isomerase